MWLEIQPCSPDLIITTLNTLKIIQPKSYTIPQYFFLKLSAFAALQSRKFARAVFSKCKQMFTAIHLHFYAKINGFSLVQKALRRPQNAPNCTIYFKFFRQANPLTPQIILNPHSLQASYAPDKKKTFIFTIALPLQHTM